MHDVSGVTGAAPVWLEVMSWLHREVPSAPRAIPPGVHNADVGFTRGVEAPRRGVVSSPAPNRRPPPQGWRAHRATIITPVSGTRIALDPDIPAAQQRVIFAAQVDESGARFLLDGIPVSAAQTPFLWEPQPGAHTLALVGNNQCLLDHVRFTVRGARPHSMRQ